MKAAASGNPLILEEMNLRQKLRRLEGQRQEHERGQHRIRAQMRSMASEKEQLVQRMPAAEQDAAMALEFKAAPLAATIGGTALEKSKDIGAAIIAAGRQMLKEGSEQRRLGSIGPFPLDLDHIDGKAFAIRIAGAELHSIGLSDIDEADAVGLAQRIVNTIRRLRDVPEASRERIAEIDRHPGAGAADRRLGRRARS